MTQDNNDLLLQIRKAYRLLFDYQTKLLGLVKYIGGRFGYNYEGGYPKFSGNGPREGKGNLERWSWDWLNLYFHEFHFSAKVNANGDKLSFAVFILIDDGYFQAFPECKDNSDRIKVEQFEKAELSQSKLILVVGYNCWCRSAYFAENNWNNKHFTLEEKGLHEDEIGKMFFKSYSVQSFFEEGDVKLQLNDFEKECHLLDIPFSQIEMKIGK